MRLAALSLTLWLGVAAAPASAAGAPGDWQFIGFAEPEARFGSDEIPRHPAPGGLALTVVDGTWHLVPAALDTRVPDPGTPSDRRRLVATPPDALAYLRLAGLVAGKVDTPDMRFKGVERDISRKSVAVPFKGTPYRFELQAGSSWLTDGTLRQKVFAGDPHPAGAEADMRTVRLLWAGDLDHDGKLDFIVANWFDDGGTMCVWLSSRAKAGELAGQAACMEHAA